MNDSARPTAEQAAVEQAAVEQAAVEQAAVEQAARERTARERLRGAGNGVLSTMSLELPGYPFGSLTPFMLTEQGLPVVYVSAIAQHTRNIDEEPKVCLTVVSEGDSEQNRQALWRITVVGNATLVPKSAENDVSERYFAFFPEARAYGGTHDFRFYSIEPVRVRYIGGFGQIYWVEPEGWSLSAPAWAQEQRGIIDHMNQDHASSLIHIAHQHGAADSNPAEMIALDPEGFHIRVGTAIHYVPFSASCMTSEAVRAEMVRLARAGRSDS